MYNPDLNSVLSNEHWCAMLLSVIMRGLIFACFILQAEATLVGYDIEQVLSTKIYSLIPTDNCQPEKMKTRNVTFGGLVLAAPEVDIELDYCTFRAVYKVNQLAHSGWHDDVLYTDTTSRLIPTYYPIDTWTCRAIWKKQTFKLPGFGSNSYKLTDEDLAIDGRPLKPGEQKVLTYKEKFTASIARATTWISPEGTKLKGSVFIEGQLYVGKLIASLDKTVTPWSLSLNDPLGQRKFVKFPGADFQHDSVTYLPNFHGECQMKMIFPFSKDEPGMLIGSESVEYLSGQPNDVSSRVFYVELLNDTVSICSYMVRPTTYAGVYLVVEPITDSLPPIDFNVDAVPNLVYGTKIEFVHVNAHLSRQRIVNFIKEEICKTRQMLLNGLISLASNIDNPNLFLGSGTMQGIHAEKAGAALYVHKCAKVPVSIADFPFCTEEVPVLMGNSSEVRFMNPITNVVYPNHTLTTCDPIAPYMYRTVEGLWMHYGMDHTPARPPNSLSIFKPLDFTDDPTSLHSAGLFSYQNLKRSANARIMKYSRRTVAGREVYRVLGTSYAHPGLQYMNVDIPAELQRIPEWAYLEKLKIDVTGGWACAEKLTLSLLTALAVFGLFVYILKLAYCVRLLARGVPPAALIKLVNPFSPFTALMNDYKNPKDLDLPTDDNVKPVVAKLAPLPPLSSLPTAPPVLPSVNFTLGTKPNTFGTYPNLPANTTSGV